MRRLGGGALKTRPIPPTPRQGGVLTGSEEADNWLRRAAEGIEREDWKLAVDALQRLVETGGDVVTTADKKVYYSARRHAHEMIAGLGEAGRRTYRLIHDPEAKRFFERGVRDHDEAALLDAADPTKTDVARAQLRAVTLLTAITPAVQSITSGTWARPARDSLSQTIKGRRCAPVDALGST